MVIFFGTLWILLSTQVSSCLLHIYLYFTSSNILYVDLQKHRMGSLHMAGMWLCKISTRSRGIVDLLHGNVAIPRVFPIENTTNFELCKLNWSPLGNITIPSLVPRLL